MTKLSKKIILILIFGLFINHSFSQDPVTVNKRHVSYNATVQQLDGSSLKGYLTSLDSASVNFLKKDYAAKSSCCKY